MTCTGPLKRFVTSKTLHPLMSGGKKKVTQT